MAASVALSSLSFRSPDVPFPSDVRDEVHAQFLNEQYDRLFADIDEEMWKKLDEAEKHTLSQSQTPNFSSSLPKLSSSSYQKNSSTSSSSCQPKISSSVSSQSEDLWAAFESEEEELNEDICLHPEKYP
jgi:hypothetical protein